MRRKGVVGRIGETYLTIQFDGGGSMRVKKSALPSLREDMRVLVAMTVTKAKKQPRVSREDSERRWRSRWTVREYLRLRAKGERPSITDLMRRAHLQPVETDDE